jgi:hypothetical protein
MAPASTKPSPAENTEANIVADALRWTLEWSARLREDGRSMTGGWPGTMSEARERVAAFTTATHAEAGSLEKLTKLSYATAKKAWLSKAQADGDR